MAVFAAKPDRFSADLIVPGRVSDDDGFIDLQNPLDTPAGFKQAILSVAGLRRLAAQFPQLRLVDAGALADAQTQVHELEGALEGAHARITELEDAQARITGLTADGFVIHKRTGPLPKKVSA